MTHSRMGTGGQATQATGSELMVYPIASQLVHLPLFQVTSSSPHSPETFQVWVQPQSLPNNKFLLPPFASNGDTKPHLWLTCVIGSGSTGIVWQCCSDESSGLYAIERLERFRNEVEVYLTLEMAYQSRQLCNCITPYCYGAFKDDRTNVLVLELCDGTLYSWDELNNSEK